MEDGCIRTWVRVCLVSGPRYIYIYVLVQYVYKSRAWTFCCSRDRFGFMQRFRLYLGQCIVIKRQFKDTKNPDEKTYYIPNTRNITKPHNSFFWESRSVHKSHLSQVGTQFLSHIFFKLILYLLKKKLQNLVNLYHVFNLEEFSFLPYNMQCIYTKAQNSDPEFFQGQI